MLQLGLPGKGSTGLHLLAGDKNDQLYKNKLNINKDNLDGAQMEVNLNLKKINLIIINIINLIITIIVIIITIINLIIPPTTSRECTSIVQIVIT